MEDLSLRPQPDERFENGSGTLFRSIEELPLGGGGNGHSHMVLELVQAIEWHPAAVFQEGHHGGRRVVVLGLSSYPIGGGRREDHTTEIATEATQLINRCHQGSRTDNPNDHRGEGQLIDFPLLAGRARIPGLELGVIHHDTLGSGVAGCAVSTMSFGFRFGLCFGPGSFRRFPISRIVLRKNIFCGFGRCSEKVFHQTGDGSALFFEGLAQTLDGLRHGLDHPVVLVGNMALHPVEKGLHGDRCKIDPLGKGKFPFGFLLGHKNGPFSVASGCSGPFDLVQPNRQCHLAYLEEKVPKKEPCLIFFFDRSQNLHVLWAPTLKESISRQTPGTSNSPRSPFQSKICNSTAAREATLPPPLFPIQRKRPSDNRL